MIAFDVYPIFRENTLVIATGQNFRHLIDFAESIQRQGRYCFSKQEAMDALGISASAFGKAAHRLIQNTKLMRVRNNFYAVVPPEYRASKGLPPTFFIDALMKFSEQPYYVGILSAAALHGAAHQAPQELQVVTRKQLLSVTLENSRIHFFNKKRMEKTSVQTMKTPMGIVRVSTPEATALDLLRFVRSAGHLDNVATVLVELAEKIEKKKLVEAAAVDGDLSYAQRLGYLLDRFVSPKLTADLHAWLRKENPSPIFLRPDQRHGVTERDDKWRVMVNTEISPDV